MRSALKSYVGALNVKNENAKVNGNAEANATAYPRDVAHSSDTISDLDSTGSGGDVQGKGKACPGAGRIVPVIEAAIDRMEETELKWVLESMRALFTV